MRASRGKKTPDRSGPKQPEELTELAELRVGEELSEE
jgi:hypothetical protein